MTTVDETPQAAATLAKLDRGFRARFLTYDEITEQLHAWASAFPSLVCVRSIGRTPEGRELWVATVGPEPDRVRPSVWIDGNMHATELAGSSVALALAEDALRLHLGLDGSGTPLSDLSAPARQALSGVLFHVMPRMSPDGAEAVLRDARYVRSAPRDRRTDRTSPRWVSGDVDGDGQILLLRKRDPSGEFVESTEIPGLMLPRGIDDTGPFYKLWPEGTVEPWDGRTVPDPFYLSDNDVDLNRNFPYSWMPEPEQAGAGRYPASEPETRAVVEWMLAHPEVFAWLNLHTFGGVYIRPLGHSPDTKLSAQDLAIWRQIGAWAETHGGYPMVSGHDEFLYEPGKPLHGDLTDFGFHQRGALAFVCELWDLFAALGIPRKKPFVDHYTHLTREDMLALGRFDREQNHGRIFRPWRRAEHPQLGAVEVGGFDIRVGVSNPPYERMPEVCRRQSAFFLRVAALAPRVVVETRSEPLGGDLHRVDVSVRNEGYLPTWVVDAARERDVNEPLSLAVVCEGCALSDPHQGQQRIGQLLGWGRGLFGPGASIFHQRSAGSASEWRTSFVVRGAGTLTLTVRGARVGSVSVTQSAG